MKIRQLLTLLTVSLILTINIIFFLFSLFQGDTFNIYWIIFSIFTLADCIFITFTKNTKGFLHTWGEKAYCKHCKKLEALLSYEAFVITACIVFFVAMLLFTICFSAIAG